MTGSIAEQPHWQWQVDPESVIQDPDGLLEMEWLGVGLQAAQRAFQIRWL